MTDRQARDLPLDAHVHTNLSPDSNVAIDDYAAPGMYSPANVLPVDVLKFDRSITDAITRSPDHRGRPAAGRRAIRARHRRGRCRWSAPAATPGGQ